MFGQDSIIWWMVKTHAKNRQKYFEMMTAPEYQHLKWIRLTSQKQVDQFLEQI